MVVRLTFEVSQLFLNFVVVVTQLALSSFGGANFSTLAFAALLTNSPKSFHQTGAFARSRLLIEQPWGEETNVTLSSPSVSHSWHRNMKTKYEMSGKCLH